MDRRSDLIIRKGSDMDYAVKKPTTIRSETKPIKLNGYLVKFNANPTH